MDNASTEFTTDYILSVVGIELGLPLSDLSLIKEGGVRAVMVRSSKTRAVWKFRSSAEEAERELQDDILGNLFTGHFFESHLVSLEVLMAVAKVCKLSDLTPFFTMASREGWLMPSREEVGNNDGLFFLGGDDADEPDPTIDDLKSMQARRTLKWIDDPIEAVVKLQGGDLPSAFAVLIEQCSVDQDALSRAILAALGGWQAFEHFSPVILTTRGGHIITAHNAEAADYLDALYGGKCIFMTESP